MQGAGFKVQDPKDKKQITRNQKPKIKNKLLVCFYRSAMSSLKSQISKPLVSVGLVSLELAT